ncbi:MAG TPA: hypothetical protein VHM28_11965 [Anaerolineales bacterium]|nr:hypothetical protein [Anaerolineales bacterium]
MFNKNRKGLIIFLYGIAGGICLSLLIGIGLLFSRGVQTTPAYPTSPAQPTNIRSVFTYTPTPNQISILDEAEIALNTGQPDKVKELLGPTIGNWTSNEDRIRGYRLLGEAELAQGHPQLAVPYFEKLYFYQPTPENLFSLATAYDAGGDIRHALIKYQELAKWENLPQEIDIEFVNMRIYDISRSLGTPVPTLTPTLSP